LGTLNRPPANREKWIPTQGPHQEEDREGREKEKGPNGPQTGQKKPPDQGSQNSGRRSSGKENVEPGREKDEEAPKENGQPQTPVSSQPLPEKKSPNGEETGKQDGGEPEEIVDNGLDPGADGSHYIPGRKPGLAECAQELSRKENEEKENPYGEYRQGQNLASRVLAEKALLFLLSSCFGSGHGDSHPLR
jgi:hypothetical protein